MSEIISPTKAAAAADFDDDAADFTRADDLYETPACAVRALLGTGEVDRVGAIWEPCAGRGAVVRELCAAGCTVVAHDLVAYGADGWTTRARCGILIGCL